jgi:hypothetical protein
VNGLYCDIKIVIKGGSFSIIVSVRETCADWIRGTEPQDDPATKGKKDPENGFDIQVPRRNVGMSYMQTRRACFSHTVHPPLLFHRTFFNPTLHGPHYVGVVNS